MPNPKSENSSRKSSTSKHAKNKTMPSASRSKPRRSNSQNPKLEPVFQCDTRLRPLFFPTLDAFTQLHVLKAAKPAQLVGTADLLVPRRIIHESRPQLVDLQPSSDWPSLSRYCQPSIVSGDQRRHGSSLASKTGCSPGRSLTTKLLPNCSAERPKSTHHLREPSQAQLRVGRETERQKRLQLQIEEALARQNIKEAIDMRNTQKMRTGDFVEQQVELRRRDIQEEARRSGRLRPSSQERGNANAEISTVKRDSTNQRFHQAQYTRHRTDEPRKAMDNFTAEPARAQAITKHNGNGAHVERQKVDQQDHAQAYISKSSILPPRAILDEQCQRSVRQAQNLGVASVTVTTTTTRKTTTTMR